MNEKTEWVSSPSIPLTMGCTAYRAEYESMWNGGAYCPGVLKVASDTEMYHDGETAPKHLSDIMMFLSNLEIMYL